MSKVFFGVLACALALLVAGPVMAQVEETDPNDSIGDGGIQNILAADTYFGTIPQGDTDLWTVPIGGSGAPNISFNVIGTSTATLIIYTSNTPGVYALDNPVATYNDTDAAAFTFVNTETYVLEVTGATDTNPRSYFIVTDVALPVVMSAFTAKYDGSQARISWRTESEENNLGFNVYRSTSQDGQYVRVNAALVKGHGTDSTVHDYSIVDDQVVEGQTYWYVIEDIDFSGATNRSQPVKLTFGELLAQKQLPTRFALLPNYPNPFNPETWFPYELAADAPVVFRVYNTRGQMVRVMSLGQQAAGSYVEKGQAVYWDGRDAHGQEVSSGVYFYQLQAGDFSAMRRMVILR